jgi:hypothetical protein
MRVLFRCCDYIEALAGRIVRRGVSTGLIVVFVLSFFAASLSEAVEWINRVALIAICLLCMLWALDKLQRELLAKP